MRVARDALGWLRRHGPPRNYDQRSRASGTPLGDAPIGLLRRRNRVLGLARHTAALLRVALDLQIALACFSHLRRIAELAAAFAGEALIARCGRGFHEI